MIGRYDVSGNFIYKTQYDTKNSKHSSQFQGLCNTEVLGYRKISSIYGRFWTFSYRLYYTKEIWAFRQA